uniref:AAA+ ATPase domain-containing protein n=1 Tax=Timema monikensis TaxID=170555 RepID=A0A7R9ELP7_9NEOP|nr:unnamed protein product [Timema monikensis]
MFESPMITLEKNIFTLQKCFTPKSLDSNKRDLSIDGKFALLQLNQELKCVCKLQARNDLILLEHFQLDPSVIVFSNTIKGSDGLPSKSIISNCRYSNVKCIKIFPLVVNLKKISITIIFKDVRNVTLWRNQMGTLCNIVKDMMKMFTITNKCIVSLENLNVSQRCGLSYIIIHSIGHKNMVGKVDSTTNIFISSIVSRERFEQLQNDNVQKLGGLDNPYQTLKEIVSYHSKFGRIAKDNKLKACQQVLLIGPPGCGKTSLVRLVASDCQATLVTLLGPEVCRPSPGDTELQLRKVFEHAIELAQESGGCILLLDEVDSVPQTTRAFTQLLLLLEQVDRTPGLVVVATTSRPYALPASARRPGRLETEIYIGVPSEKERAEILGTLLSETCPISLNLCKRVAHLTPGFVGADLALLCQHVALDKLNRQGGERDSQDMFLAAIARMRPCSLRSGLGVVTTLPAALSDIGGLYRVKQEVRAAVEWPLIHSEAFRRLGLPQPRGVLLYGPPGCAKTSLARALAASTNTTFLSVSAAELYSPFVGDAERSVVELFHRARLGAPTILFIDEIDALVGSRGDRQRGVQERVLSALLTEMDGVGIKLETLSSVQHQENNVLVVAATNRPDLLDDALLRPGRFDKLVYVPPPDETSRQDILNVLTRDMPLAEDVDLHSVAHATQLCSGADLTNLCREAGLCALTEEGMDVQQVKNKHFQKVLDKLKPSLTQSQIEWYTSYKR